MRRLLLILGTLLLAIAPATLAQGQNGAYGPSLGGSSITPVVGPPVGSCSATQEVVDTTNGNLYTCNGGVWVLVGPGASVGLTWNAIGNPIGALVLNHSTWTTTHNTTTAATAAAPFSSWNNSTAATVSLSQASPIIGGCGQDWHAAATSIKCWNIQIVPGNGTDAAATLTLGIFGAGTGLVTTLLPGPVQSSTSGGLGGGFASPEGTVPSGSNPLAAAVNRDTCYADSTAHAFLCSFNNGAFAQIGGVSSVFGRTGAVVAAANDYSFSQLSGSIALAQTPLTTTQDLLYNNAGALARLPIVTSGKCLGNTAGAWASITCASGGSGSPAIESWAGDGSDGAITADGTTTLTCLGAPSATVYTLTRDCFFTTLTVNTSTTIKTAEYRILASTSLTNNGTIAANGANGGNGGNAAGATGGTAGSTGANIAVGSLPASLAGKIGVVGATGVTTAAAGAAGTAGTAGTLGTSPLIATNLSAGLIGGAGGASVGGANAGGAGGAAGGAITGQVISKQLPRTPRSAEFFYLTTGIAMAPEGQIAGSGSGGAGAGDGTNAGGGGGGSGGNGASGGFIVLISPTITNSATGLITTTGGNGGTGGNGAAGVGGNAGGGGGGSGGESGSGGAIALIYTTLTETTAATAAAGTGGTGGSLGAGVGTGSNGAAGSTGNVSIAGTIWRISLP